MLITAGVPYQRKVTVMNDPNTTIELTRDFAAPRERVFRAWTDPAQFAQWFGSLPTKTTFDVRVGGRWTAIMEYEGNELTFRGEFREIVEPERLVLTFTDQPDDDKMAVVTVELTPQGEGTRMRFSQVGPLPAEQLDAATEGWTSFFDELEKVLAAG